MVFCTREDPESRVHFPVLDSNWRITQFMWLSDVSLLDKSKIPKVLYLCSQSIVVYHTKTSQLDSNKILLGLKENAPDVSTWYQKKYIKSFPSWNLNSFKKLAEFSSLVIFDDSNRTLDGNSIFNVDFHRSRFCKRLFSIKK